LGSGFGTISLKFLGFSPGPFENRFHYLIEMAPDFLLIVEQIKKEYNFLCASNSALETFVNITFVILSFNLCILISGIPFNYALFNPCSYNFLT
jgi:hypothetical protein